MLVKGNNTMLLYSLDFPSSISVHQAFETAANLYIQKPVNITIP
jgi:hypothetical protein